MPEIPDIQTRQNPTALWDFVNADIRDKIKSNLTLARKISEMEDDQKAEFKERVYERYMDNPEYSVVLEPPRTEKVRNLNPIPFYNSRAGNGDEYLEIEIPAKTRRLQRPEVESAWAAYKELLSTDANPPAEPVEAGNIDLNARPVVKNEDGSISTLRSIGVNMDGLEVLIPTVSEDGNILSDDEAVENYKKTGRHLGKFNSADDADAYAQYLHEQQEKIYSGNSPLRGYKPLDGLSDTERKGLLEIAEQENSPIVPFLKFDSNYLERFMAYADELEKIAREAQSDDSWKNTWLGEAVKKAYGGAVVRPANAVANIYRRWRGGVPYGNPDNLDEKEVDELAFDDALGQMLPYLMGSKDFEDMREKMGTGRKIAGFLGDMASYLVPGSPGRMLFSGGMKTAAKAGAGQTLSGTMARMAAGGAAVAPMHAAENIPAPMQDYGVKDYAGELAVAAPMEAAGAAAFGAGGYGLSRAAQTVRSNRLNPLYRTAFAGEAEDFARIINTIYRRSQNGPVSAVEENILKDVAQKARADGINPKDVYEGRFGAQYFQQELRPWISKVPILNEMLAPARQGYYFRETPGAVQAEARGEAFNPESFRAEAAAAMKSSYPENLFGGLLPEPPPPMKMLPYPRPTRAETARKRLENPEHTKYIYPIYVDGPTAKMQADLFGEPELPPSSDILSRRLFPVQEIPVEMLKLSKDVPNFKENADPETGVVEGQQLAGRYERRGTPPIVAWERNNGDLEIITGRHKFDLARRTGELTVPTQIVREADGFGVNDARTFDAESNIRDGMGSVRDYANFFKHKIISEPEATERGLLAREKGRRGWDIGKNASDDLYDLYRNGKISEDKAYAIAHGAPANSDVQRAVLKKRGTMNAQELGHYARNLDLRYNEMGEAAIDDRSGRQMDLFAEDSPWMIEMEKISRAQARMIKANLDKINAVRGAANRPEAAKEMGVDVNNPAAVKDAIEQLQAQNLRISNPGGEMLERIREAAGLSDLNTGRGQKPLQDSASLNWSQYGTGQSPSMPQGSAGTAESQGDFPPPRSDQALRFAAPNPFGRKKPAGTPNVPGTPEQFREDLKLFEEGRLPTEKVLTMGNTSELLESLGIPQDPLAITQGVIKKILGKHDIPIETVAQIPEQINNPVGVFKYGKEPNNFSILIEIKNQKGNPIIAGLEIGVSRQGIGHVVDIRTVHGKEGVNRFVDWGRNGRLLYWDIERGRKLLQDSAPLYWEQYETELATSAKYTSDNLPKSQGDFPGPRTDQKLGFAAQASELPVAGTLQEFAEKIKSFGRQTLLSRGDMPASAYAASERLTARLKADAVQVEQISGCLMRALKKEYGNNFTVEQLQYLNNVLAGKASIEKVPTGLRGPLQEMRDHIDGLSAQLIESNALDEELQAIIGQNMGTYLTRSYRQFIDPKGNRKSVDPETIRRAVDVIQSYGEDITREQAQGIVANLLRSRAASLGGALSRLGAKDASIFKRRKNIPVEIRELWGEIKDPFVNFANTAERQSAFLRNVQFLQETAAAGLEEGWLSETPTAKMNTRIGDEGGRVFGAIEEAAEGLATGSNRIAPRPANGARNPLSRYYTTPAIAKAIETMNELPRLQNAVMKFAMGGAGLWAYGKTVLSPITHIRNFGSNVFIVMRNGNWNPMYVQQALKYAGGDLVKTSNREYQKVIRELVELGVIRDDMHGSMVRTLLEDSYLRPGQLDVNDLAKANRIKLSARGLARIPQNLYRFEDDFWKVFSYYSEAAKYSRALYNKPYDKLTPEEHEAVAKTAAGIVRDTVPTYSRVPKNVKGIRRSVILGNFVSFPAEILRTTGNSMLLAKSEMKSGNPVLMRYGAMRLASLAAVLLGFGPAFIYFLGENADDKTMKALAKMAPEYQRNNLLLPIGQDEEGQTVYYDASQFEPHESLRKPVRIMMDAVDGERKPLEALREAIMAGGDPFLGENGFWSVILDVARNKKQNGAPIYMKSDSDMDKLEKIGSYSARSLAPGILSNIDRIIKANEGYISETGRSYDSGDEIKAMLTGWRKQKLDPRTSFDFAARRAVSDMGDAAQQFSQPYRAYQNNATGYNEQLLVDASEKVNSAQFRILQDLREQYMAAVKLGARPEELKTQMWKNGVPQRMIFSITQNYYLPFAGPGFGWTVENGEPKLRTPGKDYALKHFVLGRAGPLGKTVEGSVKWLGRELDRKTP